MSAAAHQMDGVRARIGNKSEGGGPGVTRTDGKRMRRLGVISGGNFVPVSQTSESQMQPQGPAAETQAQGADGTRAYTGSRGAGLADASYADRSQTITVEDGNTAQLRMVVAAVQRGRQMVSHAIAQLGATGGRRNTALTANFHSTSAGTISTIREHLTRILSGLSGDITFEVEEDSPTTRAYVYRIWSDIHLCPPWFADADADNRARTVIHECSHKFNGTDDEAYHWQPAYPNLSVSDALDNADSYAWFCMDVR